MAGFEAGPVAPGMLPEAAVYNPDPDASILQALVESMAPWNHVPPEAGGAAMAPEDIAAVDALFDELNEGQ